jgi:hypothetical protein
MSYTIVAKDILIVLGDLCDGLERAVSPLDHVL